MSDARNCTRCGELLPADAFYFVSKALGTRRGQCKACMAEVKAAQRDPAWLPTCARCGRARPRSGPGRRLCSDCFAAIYDDERRANGSHRARLNPCPSCGAARLRADHVPGTALCPICRSVSQSRRKKLRAYFNLTPREYLALIDAQGSVCAVCRRKPSGPFHIDHLHADEPLIRGAVCNSCNTMLGLARDRADILRAAAVYLEAPPAQALFPGRMAAVAARARAWHRLTRVAA